MRKYHLPDLTLAAAVAALYTVLGYFGNVFSLNFGPLQCRLAEALCVLPFLFPQTVPGLFVGCVLTNLLSPYGLIDLGVGSLATLLAAWATSKMPSRPLAILPPVLCNGLLVGGMLAWYEVGFGAGFAALWLGNALWVAGGEALVCCGPGVLLLVLLPRIPYFRRRIPAHRQAPCHRFRPGKLS